MAACVSQYSGRDRIGDDCCQPPASLCTCASGPSYGCLLSQYSGPDRIGGQLLPAAGLFVHMCLRPVLWLPVCRNTAATTV